MSETTPFFIHHRAKKQSGEPSAVFWESAKTESRALRDADNALEDAGKDPANYFKALVTNFPVVNELPPEGEISFTFCDFYQLGDDGMTWAQIPGVTLPSVANENISKDSASTIVDGVDITTGEIVDAEQLDVTDTDNCESVEDEYSDSEYADDENALFKLAEMPFRIQLLAQYTAEEGHVYHISLPHRKALAILEMDTDNHAVQDLILAAENVTEIKKYDMPALWKFTNANKKVFPEGKRHELGLRVQFAKLWFATAHIDRGILVKEWAAGNRITEVNRTASGANAGGRNVTDRKTPLTRTGLAYEVAAGLHARNDEFDIYNPPFKTECAINAIMNDCENQEFTATVKLFEEMPGGMDYSRACIIATVKTTPEGKYKEPDKHLEYLNRVLIETDHAHPDELLVDIACGRSSAPIPMRMTAEPSREDVDKSLAAGRGEFVKGVSNPEDPKWVNEDLTNPTSNEDEKTELETAVDVQVQEINGDEKSAGDALCQSEGSDITGEEATAVTDGTTSQDMQQPAPEEEQTWPTNFEPGRYEGVPNEVYHASNGISSTMLKDVRISPMFYYGRHVSKTIPRVQNDAMIRGTVVHSYVLEPEEFQKEFAIPADMPKDVASTSSDLVAIIKEYNANLPALMTPDELKAWIEAFNNDLTPPLSLSGSAEEIGLLYLSLPEEFQRLPADQKQTASAQKACIKEYNASLQPMLKVSGTRDQLLDQISTVAPELAEKERAKFMPYNTSGTKEQLTEIVRDIRPDVVTADDWHKQQEEASLGKQMISLDMYEQAKNINAALQAHPSASRLLNHPSRQSEVSYFGFDEDTGLPIRVRPDLELTLQQSRIGGDLKTTSLGYVKQEELKARLHREIISRDYHLSAAMYCDTANLDQFFWIFVNRDEGYHWVAVVEASQDLLELGRKEYRRALRMINDCTMSGNWPAPITEDYSDELTDFDLRRLEALGAA